MSEPLLYLLSALLLSGLTAVFFWPDKGIVPRWQEARHLNERVYSEDALKHIHKCEMKGLHPTIESIAGVIGLNLNQTADLIHQMQHNNLLELEGGQLGLTPQGRDSALHIIRAHRLWERYLADETGFSEAEWHGRAERYEHRLTPEEVDQLALQLGNPTHDPHGDPIPTASGDMVTHGGKPLTALPLDTPAVIVHLEDEPDVVYAQLVAEGLHPGMPVRVTESTPQRVRFWANGDEHLLAPIFAGNISVRPLPEETPPPEPAGEKLTTLKLGETAVVTRLSPACRGAERRRFLDLGILPGTQITAEMRSPSGEPTAYQIRGALIALRTEQANLIYVEPHGNGELKIEN